MSFLFGKEILRICSENIGAHQKSICCLKVIKIFFPLTVVSENNCTNRNLRNSTSVNLMLAAAHHSAMTFCKNASFLHMFLRARRKGQGDEIVDLNPDGDLSAPPLTSQGISKERHISENRNFISTINPLMTRILKLIRQKLLV